MPLTNEDGRNYPGFVQPFSGYCDQSGAWRNVRVDTQGRLMVNISVPESQVSDVQDVTTSATEAQAGGGVLSSVTNAGSSVLQILDDDVLVGLVLPLSKLAAPVLIKTRLVFRFATGLGSDPVAYTFLAS